VPLGTAEALHPVNSDEIRHLCTHLLVVKKLKGEVVVFLFGRTCCLFDEIIVVYVSSAHIRRHAVHVLLFLLSFFIAWRLWFLLIALFLLEVEVPRHEEFRFLLLLGFRHLNAELKVLRVQRLFLNDFKLVSKDAWVVRVHLVRFRKSEALLPESLALLLYHSLSEDARNLRVSQKLRNLLV